MQAGSGHATQGQGKGRPYMPSSCAHLHVRGQRFPLEHQLHNVRLQARRGDGLATPARDGGGLRQRGWGGLGRATA